MGAGIGNRMSIYVLTPPPRRALVTDVAERLRHAILHGQFAPGERLREEQLAAVLDVSRGPVREALSVLQREGLVLIKHHRGATVARLSRDDVEEVYTLRVVLERLAVQWAARTARPEDLAGMEAVIGEMAEALKRGMSAQEAAAFDVRFHTLLVESARHSRLLKSWLNLRSQIHMFLLYRAATNPDLQQVIVEHHSAILRTLRARDETAAVQVLEAHLQRSYQRILQRYDQHGIATESWQPAPDAAN
jgi:DNA-binding GntR family transcriptional regulator